MAYLGKSGKEHPAHSDVQLAQFLLEEQVELAVLRNLRSEFELDRIDKVDDEDLAWMLSELLNHISARIKELEQ